VYLFDGTTVTMPDTPEKQPRGQSSGQPNALSRRPFGCPAFLLAFPVFSGLNHRVV
jgi:hypothetical protein